jgi:hypothetical protein
MAGPLRSSYVPELARSLTVTTPNTAASPTLSALPPASGGAAAAEGLLAMVWGCGVVCWGRAASSATRHTVVNAEA